MSYRWKPNASQRKAYAEQMREQEQVTFHPSNGAIREGCRVTWIDKSSGVEMTGTVTNSSYGAKTGQHTFTIDCGGYKMSVKGRNLYDRLLSHEQGEDSKNADLIKSEAKKHNDRWGKDLIKL